MSSHVTREELKKELERFPTREELKKELERFPTREELKEELKKELARFPTREELKKELERFATKEDLKRFATKEDLKRFATKEDLDTWGGALLERMSSEIARHFNAAMETNRMHIAALDDKYRDLPPRVQHLEAVVLPAKRR